MNFDDRSIDGVRKFKMRKRVAVGLLTMSALVGCSHNETGPERASVSGVVNLNGTPLREGTIRFVPIESTAGPKVSALVTGGSFETTAEHGPVVGSNRIEIESLDGPAFDDEQALADLQANPHYIQAVKIPPVYNTNSQLKADIKSGEANVLHYDLEIP